VQSLFAVCQLDYLHFLKFIGNITFVNFRIWICWRWLIKQYWSVSCIAVSRTNCSLHTHYTSHFLLLINLLEYFPFLWTFRSLRCLIK
jgi:hypothetical protein